MSHQFIGAKLFPDKYERDRVIWEYLKEKNNTEVLKEALYRMATSTMPSSEYSEDELTNRIIDRLQKQGLIINTKSESDMQFESTNDDADSKIKQPYVDNYQPDFPATTNDDISLESLEQTSEEDSHNSSKDTPTQEDLKRMQKNFLSSIQNL